jgi:hypothetical protein
MNPAHLDNFNETKKSPLGDFLVRVDIYQKMC